MNRQQVFSWVICSLMLQMIAPVHAADRSPFRLPADRTDPHVYADAIRQVTVRGILDAEHDCRVVVTLGPDSPFRVLAIGEGLTIGMKNVTHTFSLRAVSGKQAVFEGADGIYYPVTVE